MDSTLWSTERCRGKWRLWPLNTESVMSSLSRRERKRTKCSRSPDHVKKSHRGMKSKLMKSNEQGQAPHLDHRSVPWVLGWRDKADSTSGKYYTCSKVVIHFINGSVVKYHKCSFPHKERHAHAPFCVCVAPVYLQFIPFLSPPRANWLIPNGLPSEYCVSKRKLLPPLRGLPEPDIDIILFWWCACVKYSTSGVFFPTEEEIEIQ